MRHGRYFDVVVGNPDVRSALDAIFDPAGWQLPKSGAEVLASLPTAAPWALPDGWHTDCGLERLAAVLRRHPPLGDLLVGAARPDLGRSLVGTTHEIDGVPVDVVELTGSPGDVVIAHLHVFHRVSPNTSDTPRQMFGKPILAA